MKWFTFTAVRERKITVQSKFIAVFASLIFMLAIFVWQDISRTRQLQENNEEIVQIWLKGIQTIQNINYQVEHIDYAKYQILNTKVVQERKDLFADIERTMIEVDQLLAVYEESIADDLDRANLEALKEYWASYNSAYETFQKAPLYSLEMKEATAQIADAVNNVKELVGPMVKFNHNGALAAESHSASLSRSTTIQMIIAVLLMTVILVFCGFILVRSISVPVKKVSQVLERIADGDLTVETIHIKNKDEIGTMVSAVNRMVVHLRDSVNQMLDASNKVAASSEQLLASSKGNSEASHLVSISVQEMAAGAELQAQSTQDCSKAMDEITVGIQRIAENTTEASTLTVTATGYAKTGSESMQRVVHKMQAVNTAVDHVNGVLKELEVHSHNIGEISSLIGDISSQTNLLALNAAIEAARAGDSGLGFAVVASEVRKLAGQTEAAVQDITQLIVSIQANSERAVQAMSTGLIEVNEGLQEVGEAEKSFNQIYESTEKLSQKVLEAAAATQQMAASSEEVAATINNVGSVAQQTSAASQTVASTTEEQLASSEEITSSATSLLDISQKLYTVVQTFKTKE